MRIEGWLFDAYPEAAGMRVWVVLADGRHVHFLDPWRAPFVVDGRHFERARAILAAAGTPMELSRREGAELYDNRLRPVVEVRVPPPRHGALVKKLKRAGVTLYNADIPLVQNHHYERGHFPLAFCGFEVEGGLLSSHELRDDPWAPDYALPPLRALHLALAGSEHAGAVNPNHAARGGLVLTHEGRTHLLEGDPAEQLETLDRRMKEWDPDLLTTDWGDSYLIPHLLEWARRARRPLSLSRDAARDVAGRDGRSFFSYGRTVYQSGAQVLFGRWHLDLKNSFFLKECGFSGLYEIARIAKIPVQRAARSTIGTSLSSMQVDVALRRGLLIPLDKAQPEDFRPASQLIVADKGGLVYEPDVGWHERVAEYDFVSMYPTLMVKHNISPETVNCACCRGEAPVPEVGHHLCRRRRGLIPEVLAPILEKRAAYKRLAQTDHPRRADFKARAAAHKWCLVTCLEGTTQLLYRWNGVMRHGAIQELDALWNGSRGEGCFEVVGMNHRGRACFRPVRRVVRQLSPPALLEARLSGGRRVRMTPDHGCFVLEKGRLRRRRADKLRVGNWVPIFEQLPFSEKSDDSLDVVRVLLKALPENEKPFWRVYGSKIGDRVASCWNQLLPAVRKEYTVQSFQRWKRFNYIPLSFFSVLGVASHSLDSVGRGKRRGGLIRRIPSRFALDRDLGYFLGFYVGDGSISGRMIRLDVGSDTPDILRELRRILKEKFDLIPAVFKEKRARMHVVQINSVALCEIVRRVFELGPSADRGKLRVPPLVLNGSKNIRRGFLEGLLASDGHASNRRNFLGWVSMSSCLIEQVAVLLGMEQLQYRFSNPTPRLARVDLRGPDDIKAFLKWATLTRKHQRMLGKRWAGGLNRRPEMPVVSSGLLGLCRAARVARVEPRIDLSERISKATARIKVEQVRARIHRLSMVERFRLERMDRLLGQDIVFSRVRSLRRVLPRTPNVYCVELDKAPRMFSIQGGIGTSNCFGYLGYKNARFGKIEAHESVTAWGREAFLRAKDFVEDRGRRVLHGNVDCVWVQSAAGRDDEGLRRDIETATGCPVGLEGVYKWLRFCPSKTDPESGVPNRYFGAFENGELKVRGLALRRRDTPPIFVRMQNDMLRALSQAEDVAGCRALLPRLEEIAGDVRARIAEGRVEAPDLAVTFHLSRDPSDYVSNGPSAVAARRLAASGVALHAGETVKYLIGSAGDKVVEFRAIPLAFISEAPEWDTEKYLELWDRARREIVEGLGEAKPVQKRIY